ncbi:MAG TPA: DNA-binding response regulator [Cytophagales bacterium]|nr:DNA-binding response regulator [Cytophagales bacterium]HAA21986.1 DNA-binding response regulator [Cytophagales bacterium]HAP63791.1 DNA-binding response regulator [Cytophagales bacterium]
MINVCIIDDHALFMEGVKSLFSPEDGIQISCSTQNGHESVSLLREQAVDVLLLDIDMPIIDGLATMELLKKEGIEVPTLMLTMHQSMKRIKGALERGAQGYILKDASKKELVEAITKVSRRENYFHPKITNEVFDYFRGKTTANSTSQELSEREVEIIKCLSEGKNTKDMAEELFLSEHTVKTHRRNIMQKLRVKTSAELVKYAADRDLI